MRDGSLVIVPQKMERARGIAVRWPGKNKNEAGKNIKPCNVADRGPIEAASPKVNSIDKSREEDMIEESLDFFITA